MNLYSTTILSDGPIAYYRLGDLTGASAVDASGNGHTGTYAGGYTLGQAGAIQVDNDAAAKFDGTSGLVAIPFSTAFNFGSAGWTYEFWIKTTSNTASQVAIYMQDYGGGHAVLVGVVILTGGYPYIVLRGTENNVYTLTSATNVTDGNWRHVVCTGTSGGTIQIYIDGAFNASTPIGATTINYADASTPLRIAAGSFSPTPGTFLGGLLDEVAIYPTALSAVRITAHYNAARAALFPGPVIANAPFIRAVPR